MKMLFASFLFLRSIMPACADDSAEAQALLQKIQLASQKVSYAGIFVFQHDNQLMSSRIIHRYEAGDEKEKIEKLDGRRREYVRHNDDVISYQPDTRTLRAEKRETQDMFPAVLAFSSPNLSEHYQFRLAEHARVAGVECRLIVIDPRDAFRYGYRLCAAIPSNLMVLAQTVDSNRQVLEQIAFTSLNIGPVDESVLNSDFPETNGWTTVRSDVVAATESGWTVKKMPAGFKKIREVRRLINNHVDTPVNNRSTDLHEVLQMVFSDGLATISVFIEPFDLNRRAGIIQKGSTTIAGYQLGKFWVTLVGEVPVAAIKLLSDSIEYKSK